jgi:hypothetical protein
MNAPCKLGLFLLAVMLLAPLPRGLAQDDSSPAPRKLVKSPKPLYPNLARTMNLSGTVRIEALVEPNGSVKSVEVKGGNPLLAQSPNNGNIGDPLHPVAPDLIQREFSARFVIQIPVIFLSGLAQVRQSCAPAEESC